MAQDSKNAIFVRLDEETKKFFDWKAKQYGSLKAYLIHLASVDGYKQKENID